MLTQCMFTLLGLETRLGLLTGLGLLSGLGWLTGLRLTRPRLLSRPGLLEGEGWSSGPGPITKPHYRHLMDSLRINRQAKRRSRSRGPIRYGDE